MKYIAMLSVLVVAGVFANLVHESKMLSYLSSDPKVCVNCHTMTTHYETWQHSSHRNRATCVDCHLPRDSFVNKMLANSALYTKVADNTVQMGRRCWECHRGLPHGIMRNLSATQNNFTVKVF